MLLTFLVSQLHRNGKKPRSHPFVKKQNFSFSGIFTCLAFPCTVPVARLVCKFLDSTVHYRLNSFSNTWYIYVFAYHGGLFSLVAVDIRWIDPLYFWHRNSRLSTAVAAIEFYIYAP